MTLENSLYRQVLREDFHLLARELQVFHSFAGWVRLSGRCTVNGPQTAIGRLMGKVFALPKTTEETSFSFELEADTVRETWRRRFPGRLMTSRMRLAEESASPGKLQFNVAARLPVIGLLAEYRGYLNVGPDMAAT